MERMTAPLSEVVPILFESHGKARGVAKIPFGEVPVAMLDCIRAMHENGNLFIDVKPENFMLGSASADSSAKRCKKESVGQRVRLIDFGLVERFGDMSSSKHRLDAFPDATLIGTPTYASLNIMSGHTPSRRDDLEALGYVVSELILMLASAGAGTSGSAGRRKKNDADVLPWSHAASDHELRQIKSREMDVSKRSTSKLFAGLKSAGADIIMGNYFSTVRGLAYTEAPDYDSIRCDLKKLVVTTEGAKEASRASSPPKPKKSPARKMSARRKHEDEDSDDSVEVVDENTINRKSSGKIQKVSAAKESVAARTTRNVSKSREIGTQTDEIGDDSDSMDWETINTIKSTARDGSNVAAANYSGVLKLCVTEGPHAGHEISFGGDHPGTVCVGKDPASRAMKDVIKFAVSKDESASSVHAKFAINSKSNVHSVRVTDMASSSGTFVNGSCLPSGKSRQAFVGDKIKIGGSLFEIRKA
jgi:serine/threonine protein kinase